MHRRLVIVMAAIVCLAAVATPAFAEVTPPAEYKKTFVLFKGDTYSEKGPAATPGGGDGNTYGPEILVENGLYRMWYGAQGVDGREYIHYAESADGWNWDRKGIQLAHPEHPLIQDPSIVVVDGTYYMYYTVAHIGITDTIHLATSADGLTWERQGRVLDHGASGAWDDANVGRPSIMYEDGVFKLWYDGCQGLPGGDLLSPYIGENCASFRNVGYATSTDGLNFVKHPDNPLISPAEAVHVSKYRGHYVMLHENQQGTRISLSNDGVVWEDRGFFLGLSGEPHDEYGQVTPFLLYDDLGKPRAQYMGLARDACWCQNLMGAALLPADSLDTYIDGTSSSDPTGPVPPSLWVTNPDYSDTFTEGTNGRVADRSFPVGTWQGPDALKVENVHGHVSQSWTDAKWAFSKDDLHVAEAAWPGGSGRGSATGMVQTGWTSGTLPAISNDWGISYGLRRDFVVQVDMAVPAGATVSLTTASGRDSQTYGDGLTIRFRSPNEPGIPEVGLFWPGLGEVDTGFRPGITPGAWHTYAARINLAAGEVTVFVDCRNVGTASLAAAGIPAEAISHGTVSVGAELGLLVGPVGWADNFLVGPLADDRTVPGCGSRAARSIR